eukprot:767001-Pyramimonas_sp.AAC.1
MVTGDALKEQLATWMQDAGMEEHQWKVLGNSPGRRFTVQMSGDANAGMRKVKQARRFLRQNNEWRQFSCPTLEGGRSRIYVGLDKSDKMVRREIQTKKLAGL